MFALELNLESLFEKNHLNKFSHQRSSFCSKKKVYKLFSSYFWNYLRITDLSKMMGEKM